MVHSRPAPPLPVKKAYEALPTGGVLIVYERLIDDARRAHAAALLASLNMLIMTCAYRKLDSVIAVMKAAEQQMRRDTSDPLNRARAWRIFVQRSVRSHVVVIAGIGLQNPT
jgi:hypothetical protein